MVEESNINIIRKKDPDFAASYFNFEELRRLGIQHIGELSGKIWTDHNAHDPGITILEMLCYALLDLGYRTTLPIEDILAPPPNTDHQNQNFFTPAQILSSNPITILDYRKMLMDIDGIANAWLEVAHDQELYLDCPIDEVEWGTGWEETGTTGEGVKDQLLTLRCEDGKYAIPLNGLYRVKIQLEREQPYCNTKKTPRRKREEIIAEVREKLLQHRNLGEDFLDIRILHEEEVGVQAKIELSDSADPEETYVAILSALQQFFNPSIRFYTLGELIDKGKSIEEIFSGRPFKEKSFGFIDTDELARLQLPKEVHFSDVYNVILNLKGVESVRDLFIPAYLNGVRQKTFNSVVCEKFIHHYTANCAPVFCVDLSEIRVFRDSSIYRLDQRKVDRLLKKAFGNKQKAKTSNPLLLDRPVPNGRFRPELGDYFSIQNEFPLVYGIGKGHLGEEVGEVRKAQALQLKAYLLLFDQLLASYLSQLSHLGDLFSMTPDSQRDPANRRTYFAQRLESIPEVKKLIRFYDQSDTLAEGDIMAYPVDKETYQCALAILEEDSSQVVDVELLEFNSRIEQKTLVEQFRREFEQGDDLRIDVFEEECGYFFAVELLTLNYVLLGKKRYKTRSEAKLAAESVIFLGMLADNYRMINDLVQGKFSFEILFQPTDYLSFLLELQEDRELYLRRRNTFLDHLLARFSETFTDYSLLVYQASEEQKVENKAQLLSQYDDLSRNRGRGFNYCAEPWDTDNVSGLEKRVSTLSGIHGFQRRYLCNFEVADRRPEYLVQLIDYRGRIAFASSRNLQSEETAHEASQNLLEALRHSHQYETRDNLAESRYQLLLNFADNYAVHPQSYFTRTERDKKRLALSALFREDVLPEDVFEADYAFQLWLESPSKGPVKKSEAYFDNETQAQSGKDAFIRKINTQPDPDGASMVRGQKLDLIADLDEDHLYLDASKLQSSFQLDPTRYRWAWQDQTGQEILLSTKTFASPQEAQKAFMTAVVEFGQHLQFSEALQTQEPYFYLETKQGQPLAKGQSYHMDEVQENRKKALHYFQRESETGYYTKSFSRAYQLQLEDANGSTLLSSKILFRDKRKAEKGWRDLKILVPEDSHWRLIEKGQGTVALTLWGTNGLLLAETPTFNKTTEKDAAERLSSIKDFFTDKKQLRFLRVASAYGFQLWNQDDENECLLESYYLYPTKLAAYQGLQQLVDVDARKQNYFMTGDEANSNHSFSIQDSQKNFIAFHPQSYGEVKEREKALSRVLKATKNFHFPIKTPNEYVYRVVDDNQRTWLRSEKVFPDIHSARQNFHQLLHLASRATHYQTYSSKDGNDYFFRISNSSGNISANSPAYSDGLERETAILGLQGMIQKQVYETKIRRAPSKYKFRFWWEGPNGELESLCESIQSFQENPKTGESGKDVAKREYRSFVQKMRQGKIAVVRVREGVAYRLKFLEKKKALALYPSTYRVETHDGKDDRLEDAKKLLNYVSKQTPTKRGPRSNSPLRVVQFPNPDGGKYVYRLIKKGLPLAFHPCACLDREETGQEDEITIQALYQAALVGYDFLEICLAGDIVCQIDQKYHYVIRGQKDDLVYFISFQAYETARAAIDAFQKEYLDVIRYASCIDHYCLPLETGFSDLDAPSKKISLCHTPQQTSETCSLSEQPLVIMPEEAQHYFLENFQNGIDEVVRRFCTYPIRKLKIKQQNKFSGGDQWKFYFQLIRSSESAETGSCQVDWLSTHCFDSIEKVRQHFRHFLYLLKVHGSYRTFLDEDQMMLNRRQGHCPGFETAENEDCSCLKVEQLQVTGEDCCHYVGLQEVLVESTCHFEEEGDAWGRDRLISSYACDNPKTIEGIIRSIARSGFCQQVLTEAFSGTGFNPDTIERNNLHYLVLDFSVLDPLEYRLLKFESLQGFPTAAQALLYFEKIKERLLGFCDDIRGYRIHIDENCQYRVGFGAHCQGGKEATDLANCLSEGQIYPVTGFLRKKGIEQFLELASNEKSFHTFSTYQDGELCFSFHIVGNHFQLARHPHVYHTAEERDALATSLRQCSKTTSQDLVLICEEVLPATGEADPTIDDKNYRYVIYCNDSSGVGDEVLINTCHQLPSSAQPGTAIWSSYQTYCGCTEEQLNNEAESTDILLEIMAYARESRFYYQYNGQTYLCRIPFSREDTLVEEHHENCLENGDLLAYSDYTEIEDLVCIALHYPFVKREDGYGFQLYCDDFPDSFPIDELPCVVCEDQNEELGTGEETGMEPNDSKGTVVWESVGSYVDLNTAKCYYELFCALIQESSNIVPTGDEDCGPYSFELLNPNAILATHPQCYSLRAELRQAIERTRACINIEGFHLLEHILLRPGKGCKDGKESEACNCLLPVDPDCDCELCINRFENDPCAQPQGMELMTGDTGFDPCKDEELCDTYIPGADPYSFWVTVLLPNWPERFRRADYRQAFQDLIRREAPAHIGLRVLWIRPEEMCKFEVAYRKWLRWLSQKEDCYPNEVVCQLKACLSQLNYCPDIVDLSVFEPQDEEQVPLENDVPIVFPDEASVAVANLFTTIRPSDPCPRIAILGSNSRAVEASRNIFGDRDDVIVPDVQARMDTKISLALESPRKDEVPSDLQKNEAEIQLSSKDKRKRLRRRLAQYQENIEQGVPDHLKTTNVYKRVLAFLSNPGDFQLLQKTIQYVLQYGVKRKKTEPEKAPYIFLMQNTLWNFLDQQVHEHPSEVQHAEDLVPLLAKLKDVLNLRQLKSGWNAEELKSWTDASTIDDYLSLIN